MCVMGRKDSGFDPLLPHCTDGGRGSVVLFRVRVSDCPAPIPDSEAEADDYSGNCEFRYKFFNEFGVIGVELDASPVR